ncbi:hypothetical protein QBC32DRAFT_144766 [Pseudoneurospora amorphoporcata]|uniref:Uncharacterized protein n=1 Tax=Pseudoneurospora amorphoporcata TaxID=241081 RepID=A0AAN6SGH1_9PEZI|nr:hypothetical protein QBC32DRAFT_144766 [Pseudoneurospora amorphoporcata]
MAPSSQTQSRPSPPLLAAMSRRQYPVSISSLSSIPSSSSSPSSISFKRATFEAIHHIRASLASATQKRSNDPNCMPQPGVNLCEKPAEATSKVTWAVVGSVLGFVAATTIIVAYILHLRRKKVHQMEDQNDPFQMSDYGFDEAAAAEAARSKANLFRRSQQSSTTSFSTPSPPKPLERRLSFDESPYAFSAAAGIRSSTTVGGDVIYSDISTPPVAALPVGVGMRGEGQLFGVPGLEGMDLGGMPMDRERERERSRSRARSSYSHSPHNRQMQRRSRPSSVQSAPFSHGHMTPPRGPRPSRGGDGASAASGSGLRSPLSDDASSASVRSSEMLRPPVDGDVDTLSGAAMLGPMPWEKGQQQDKVVVTETTMEKQNSNTRIAEEYDTVNEPKSNTEIRMVAAPEETKQEKEEKPTAVQQETVEVKKEEKNEPATRI